jgi:hypothetical protein
MTVLKDKIVTIKKPRRCSACSRMFPVGTKMQVLVSVIDGDLSNWYSCETCTQLMNEHREDFADFDGMCWENCVADVLTENQTPEELYDSYTPPPTAAERARRRSDGQETTP